jgi:hypothetical protein
LNFGRGRLSAAGVGDCAVFAGGHPKTGPGSDIDVFCFADYSTGHTTTQEKVKNINRKFT